MSQIINNIRHIRTFLMNIVNGLSADQLNKIPEGFNNNIIWNIAHLISAQQGLCYVRAGLSYHVDEEFFKAYAAGTKPETIVDEAGINIIKKLLFSTLDLLESDYNDHIFSGYKEWTTRYGIQLSSIDEALGYIMFHEGTHLGYIIALKRVVG